MGLKNRKIKNYLLMPQTQLRYVFILIAIVNAPLSLLVVYFYIEMQKLKLQLQTYSNIPPELENLIIDTGFRLSLSLVITIALILIFVFLGTILASHKFIGPMYVINKCLESMKNGDYKIIRTLRKDDEMQQTMSLLKELSKGLETSHKTQVPTE